MAALPQQVDGATPFSLSRKVLHVSANLFHAPRVKFDFRLSTAILFMVSELSRLIE
jgi:hypothetical protein